MTLLHSAKTNFTAGEVTRRLLGRADLRSYENGALTLRNVAIHPTGGLSRRDGLRLVDEAAGDGRLIAFEFNTEQTYLLALTDRRLAIHRGDAKLAELPAPWTAAQLRRLAWTQSADTLLLCHPDVPPKRLTRRAGGAFQLDDWPFLRSGAVIRQPYARFAPPELTLKPSAATGAITLEASADLFEPGHAGTALRIAGKQVTITGLNGPRVAAARVDEALAGTAATADWQEAAFGPVRGWPATACFHQDRLVIGGSRDLPNRLWLSRAGDLWNFDLGTGEDDEAIEFALLSDQVNAVCAVFSGRHLQVFTSGGEWRVAGEPLTPATLRAERQTRIGSAADRHIPPVDVDGATLFVGRGGRKLREFLYTDAEQAYQAT
ncbi:MAG TPA: hypothetical protein VEH84_11270, partial [Alphaproteobacteria bacterium]|nr:hypothetical protein [Alphaproteobacteria bacterium]